MKKEKISLKDLQVQSFVTTVTTAETKTIQGEGTNGGFWGCIGSMVYDCGTINPISAPECNRAWELTLAAGSVLGGSLLAGCLA